MSGRILVTGARGRIGRVLAGAWAERDVVLLDREDGDLAVPDVRWTARFAGVASVVHLAADPDPASPFASAAQGNIAMTLNVVGACLDHGVGRLVYASSVWADYGAWRLADRMTWYAASKIAGEALVKGFADQTGRPAVCLRFAGYDPIAPPDVPHLEAVRLDDAAILHHVEAALAFAGPGCAIRYAAGRLGSPPA